MAMLDCKTISADLPTLQQAASSIDELQKNQAATLIRVGEYGPALDVIAYASLNNRKTMPAELFAVFEKLATVMELDGDPELEGVARLVKAQAHSTGN
ncbi:MAG: hypothetical protein WDN49_16190 [Acetobacteraceae bacterium]